MNEYIYMTVAYAVLIFTFSFCGILRLCNLFPHAIKNMEDIYPACRLVVGIYFSVLLLFPCMLYPQSHDAQLLARCFWIIYTFICLFGVPALFPCRQVYEQKRVHYCLCYSGNGGAHIVCFCRSGWGFFAAA